VKALREARNWTRRELERQAGIGQGVVARIERKGMGHTTIEVGIKLARTLHVSLDALTGLVVTPDEDDGI
jgi:transcriptional regulator with XRE-family HTH domain